MKYDDIRRNPPLILSVAEVACVLGVARSTAKRLMRDAMLPSFNVGRRRLVRRDDLLRWVEEAASRT